MKLNLKLLKNANVFRVERRSTKTSVFINPLREWFVALMVVSTTMVVLFGYAGFLLYREMQGDDKVDVPGETLVTYRRVDAATVLSTYKERAATFAKLRADRSHAYVPPVAEGAGTAPTLAE